MPTLERRHFDAIAHILSRYTAYASERDNIIEHFADELTKTNPNFNRQRFQKACERVEERSDKTSSR